MISVEGKYNIKAISTMLDIQPGTLRAWERRYQIIEPIRNEAGHRLYSEEHVAILRWLLEKINRGFTIGQAVELFQKGNITLHPFRTEQNDDYAMKLSESIRKALLSFDENVAQQLLNEAFSLFCVDKVTIDILGRLLVKVSQMRVNKEITMGHEQFVTSFLRTKIGNIYHGSKINEYLPKVVAVCGPNETQELGLMTFTLFLRRKGFEVIYLGTGIPLKDIESVLKEVDAQMFFTSCVTEENLHGTLELVRQLAVIYPNLIIGAGGYSIDELLNGQSSQFEGYFVGQMKQDWERWLLERLKM